MSTAAITMLPASTRTPSGSPTAAGGSGASFDAALDDAVSGGEAQHRAAEDVGADGAPDGGAAAADLARPAGDSDALSAIAALVAASDGPVDGAAHGEYAGASGPAPTGTSDEAVADEGADGEAATTPPTVRLTAPAAEPTERVGAGVPRSDAPPAPAAASPTRPVATAAPISAAGDTVVRPEVAPAPAGVAQDGGAVDGAAAAPAVTDRPDPARPGEHAAPTPSSTQPIRSASPAVQPVPVAGPDAVVDVAVVRPPAPGPTAAAQLTPQPVAPRPLADQLGARLVSLRTAGDGEHVLTLRVEPETFGPVRVVAHIGAEGMRIELLGATDQARDALRAALPDLRRDLAGAGLQAELGLGGRGPGSGQEDPGGGRASAGPGTGAPGTGPTDVTHHDAHPSGRPDGRVDLIL